MDEKLKNQLMISAIAFGLTVTIYQVGWNRAGSATGFLMALLLGAVVGGIAFAAAHFMQK